MRQRSIALTLYVSLLALSCSIQADDSSPEMHIWMGNKNDEISMGPDAPAVLTLRRSQPLRVGVEVAIKEWPFKQTKLFFHVSLRSGCAGVKPWVVAEENMILPANQSYGFVKFIACNDLTLGGTELIGILYADDEATVLQEIILPVEIVP
jgi:hypothetical protein